MSFFTDIFREISLIKILEALNHQVAEVSAAGRQKTGQLSNSAQNSSFAEIIEKASEKYGIDPKVIQAVIKQESSFNPNAISSCGAQGLMQLMPATAKSLGVNDPFNAEQNIMAGTKYLKQKLDEFNGDLNLALAAYNAGSGALRKYGGVPPYKETRAYVNKIVKSIDYLA